MAPVGKRFNLSCAFVCAFLCSASFQVGFIAVLPFLVSVAYWLLPSWVGRKSIAALAAGICATALFFGLQTGLNAALGTKSSHPEAALYVYDLSQLSRYEKTLLLPRSDLIRPETALSQVESTAGTGSLIPLIWGSHPIVRDPVSTSGYLAADLQHAWISAILHHPLGYFEERSALLGMQLTITHPIPWVYQVPPSLNYPPLSSALQRAGLDYLSPFTRGPLTEQQGGQLYSVWVYLLLTIIAWAVLRRRGGGYRQITNLAIAIVLYCAVMFFATTEGDYRFVYPIVVVGTVMAILALPRRLWRAERSDASPVVGDAVSASSSAGGSEIGGDSI
jgi:hypothetical protein